MSKLKNIIKQLSEEDYKSICDNMMEGGAEKSAYLLRFIREKQLSDSKIMEELDVNNNAYYTLRSRLNQRIEEFLLQQMENPRTDLLKKVANIQDILYTKKRAIAIATLKKLEKELIDYDLSNELTIIYKTLKKLHLNYPEHFYYSQLYNRHIAYMLALDKAEDLLAEYFKKYGYYIMTGEDVSKLELGLLFMEMQNVCKLYESHRLYVYQSCMYIFHRLFVDPQEENIEEEAIEDILQKIQKIFEQYYLDTTYYHLKIVFEFLKLEYYNHYKVYKKAEKFYEAVNSHSANLISNYGLYTFPVQFLLTKMKRAQRLNIQKGLYEDSVKTFEGFECDENDTPKFIVYYTYRALSAFYVEKYEESSKWLYTLLNQVSMKRFPHAQLEIKIILLLQYCVMKDEDLFNQMMSSVQRQIRMLGKENCDDIVFFLKALKIVITDKSKAKSGKLKTVFEKIKQDNFTFFSPLNYIKLDDELIQKLI